MTIDGTTNSGWKRGTEALNAPRHMDILARIAAYDCSDGGHCDAAQGSAYDLMNDAGAEIKVLRAALTQFVAACDTSAPINLINEIGMARKAAGKALGLED